MNKNNIWIISINLYPKNLDKGLVTVFTDGACSNNGKDTASAGVGIFWGSNHPLNVSKKLYGQQTNNRAEIIAALIAITQSITYGAQELNILTDSEFMIKCVTQWMIKWKNNGWKTSNGDSVKNIDILKKLDDLCTNKMKVKWDHIPAHKGHYGINIIFNWYLNKIYTVLIFIEGNEEADRLARDATKH
jgi:ribonuclease HI